MVPLSDAVSVGATEAALLSVAVGWFSYAASAWASRRRIHRGLQNAVLLLKSDLGSMELWAGSDDSPGYRRSKSPLQYYQEKPDWHNPSRLLFCFDYPTVKNLARSDYVDHLKPIMDDFVALNDSIVRLSNYYNQSRRQVMRQPMLCDSVVTKLAQGEPPTTFTPTELEFIGHVFVDNYWIHVRLLGGDDSEDERCLYKAFRKAEGSLESFEAGLMRESLPNWFWIFHVIAVSFLAAAGV